MREEEYTTKIVRVGGRGQIVIPKAIRKIERIKPKDTLKITNVAGTITIKKVKKKTAEEQIFQFIENSGLTIKDWRDIKKDEVLFGYLVPDRTSESLVFYLKGVYR